MNIVVIPVYKEALDGNEYKSLRQCLKVLHKHRICLVGPKGLDYSIYEDVFLECKVELNIETFDPAFFESIRGYNRLMLCEDFYKRFAGYEYMLIYQLDAYVFRDELDYWCDKGYDYVGAPWMKLNGKLDVENAGNGGFSLRRISSFVSLFSHKGRLLTLKGLCCLHRYRGPLHKPFCVLSGLFGKNNHLEDFLDGWLNEDLLYVTLKHKRGGYFWIPNSLEAMFFSFEGSPSMLFEMTGGKLPFGCHAWNKNEYEQFWKKYIR